LCFQSEPAGWAMTWVSREWALGEAHARRSATGGQYAEASGQCIPALLVHLPQRKKQTPLTDSEATASDDAYHDRSPCACVIGDFTETLRGSYAASITGEETRTRTSKHSGHEPRRPLAREGYASRTKLQRPADNALSCRHECYTLRGACPRRHLPHERHTLCGARPRRATPATFLGVTRPHPPCTGLRRVVRIAPKDRCSCLPASLK